MNEFAALLIVGVCLLGSFFFSGIETAVLLFNRVRLRALVRRQNRRAMILARYVARPERLLATCLVGNTVVNTIAATLVASLLLRRDARFGGVLAFLLMSAVLYAGCELVPKSLFRQFPTRLSVALADALHVVSLGLRPLVWSFELLTALLLRMFGGDRQPRREVFVTREELKRLMLDSEGGNPFPAEARRMIQEDFNLRHLILRQVMTPWEEVATIPADATAREVLEKSRACGFSRLPAFETDGTVAGLVNVYDILFDPQPNENATARHYLRRAFSLPAEMPLDESLHRIRATRQPMAIVRDSRQRPIGIVTIEDLLARLIGEIEG